MGERKARKNTEQRSAEAAEKTTHRGTNLKLLISGGGSLMRHDDVLTETDLKAYRLFGESQRDPTQVPFILNNVRRSLFEEVMAKTSNRKDRHMTLLLLAIANSRRPHGVKRMLYVAPQENGAKPKQASSSSKLRYLKKPRVHPRRRANGPKQFL